MKNVFTFALVIVIGLSLCFMSCSEAKEWEISDLTSDLEFDVKFILNHDIVLDYSRIFNPDGSFTDFFLAPPAGGGQTLPAGDFSGTVLCETFLRDTLGFTNQAIRFRRIDMIYLDTPCQSLDHHGWINRFRQRNWENGWQLMNRQRVPLPWPLTEQGIDAAVRRALADGFEPSNRNDREQNVRSGQWHFEVDWSYASAVLSVTRSIAGNAWDASRNSYSSNIPFEDPFTNVTGRGSFPSIERIRELFKEHLPPNLKNRFYFNGQFDQAVAFGSVFYRRYEVRIDGIIDCPLWIGNNNFRIDVLALPHALILNEEGNRVPDWSVVEWVIEASHANMGAADGTTGRPLGNLGLDRARIVRNSLYDFLGGTESGVILPIAGLRAGRVYERWRQ